MERICLICNSMVSENINCPNCEEKMTDLGRIQEFRDAYGNAEEIEENEKCIHYFQCPICKTYKKVLGDYVYM
ncbi:hypothetical protein [Clostridium fallax]|uniref:Uncharacterized protein n=1 Tax=Clostridium fallax TaxID=1533 RepID=A0A1M4UAI7_9CLOT|nr:hypothetical protein [Clostridium fallax]SHE53694.1 hypothetical protein SAMN05443638_104117 [Clostridium fallax]SQB06159.1 Uncharacterised protein [Clostridium fallax]